MSEIDMAAVMDAITATLTAGGRKEAMFPYPAESISVPCWLVGFPESIDFDAVFGRGADAVTLPVWFVVPRGTGTAARDAISAIVAGARSIKAILEPDLGGAVQTCRLVDCKPEFINVAGVDYAAAKFSLKCLT